LILVLVTTKTSAGLRPVKSLQNTFGLRPDEKIANLMTCGQLQTMQYAAGLVNSLQIVASLLPVKSLQMSAGLLLAYDFSCFFLTWWTGNFSTFSTAVGSLNVINPKPLDLLVAGSFMTMTSARSPKAEKYSRIDSGVVCQLSPPMNILPGSLGMSSPLMPLPKREQKSIKNSMDFGFFWKFWIFFEKNWKWKS
jgi:hypothetical protein